MQHRLWRTALAIALVGLGLGVRPAAATTYTLSLWTDDPVTEVGYGAYVHVQSNPSPTPSGYIIYIYDQTAGKYGMRCTNGCGGIYGEWTPGTHTYVAYLAKSVHYPTYPPADILATSSPMNITYTASTFTVSLSANPTTLKSRSASTLTATLNKDLPSGLNYTSVAFYDQGSGQRVGFACFSGRTCSTTVTQDSPQTRSYIAYVGENGPTNPPPHIFAASNTVTVTWTLDQGASLSAGNVQFDVEGRLPTFPCTGTGGCTADFSGTGTGGGEATVLINEAPHTAEFVIPSGTVGGWATYAEPGPPVCPLAGDATNTMGRVTLSGDTTGVIHKASVLPEALPEGTITNVSFALDFTYARVGATARLQITGGSMDITFTIPNWGSGTLTESILRGEGQGVFVVDAEQAATRCQSPGELLFRLIGDSTFVLNA